ncbi:hypothetical protein KIL84_008524 [Mauremys mutica]|uniref:Uncharacterized protein n=1 Tax=Mauremys mutica TaxID=74926 RepID=A0A9D3X7Z4_9SAUR|nr:hypothetical protein KIL84_008524 [Mauremys mutica]
MHKPGAAPSAANPVLGGCGGKAADGVIPPFCHQGAPALCVWGIVTQQGRRHEINISLATNRIQTRCLPVRCTQGSRGQNPTPATDNTDQSLSSSQPPKTGP